VFDGSVKVGDLLTGVSVLIAVAVFLYTRRHDQDLSRQDYAERIRAAAGQTLSRLERTRSILDSFYELMQPAITETDENLVQTKNPIAARDFLWKRSYENKLSIMSACRAEEIEVAYAPLFGYDKHSYELFSAGVNAITAAFEHGFSAFLDPSQDATLGQHAPYESAVLGNVVRRKADDARDEQRERMRTAARELETYLLTIVSAPADAIVAGVRVNETVPNFKPKK
jgi:hypothetical protein